MKETYFLIDRSYLPSFEGCVGFGRLCDGADLGTGSGSLAVGVNEDLGSRRVAAIDISPVATDVMIILAFDISPVAIDISPVLKEPPTKVVAYGHIGNVTCISICQLQSLTMLHFMFTNATESSKEIVLSYHGPLMLVSILGRWFTKNGAKGREQEWQLVV